MAKLIYFAIMSLDGYIEDTEGKFDWAAPDEETHTFINDLERPVGTYLYGRRMYETMTAWETDPELTADSATTEDFAGVWQNAEKIVYSSSLEAVSTKRTRIESRFDAEEVRQLKDSAERDLAIGGPNLAAHAFAAGLVDECQIFIAPITIGSGKPAFPTDVRVHLELTEKRRFGSGYTYLRYAVTGAK